MIAPSVHPQTVILNTRPLPMGETLQAELAQQGLNALSFPTIVNQALDLQEVASASTQPLNELVHDLIAQLANEKTHWVFISKSSVQFFKHFISSLQSEMAKGQLAANSASDMDFSPKGQVIAVGKTTKAELLTLNSELNVLTPTEANSEALLAMHAFDACHNIVLVKGVGGRGLITEHFTGLQKRVIELSLYQRSPRVFALQEVKSWLKASVVLATSVDIAKATLDNLHQLTDTEKQTFLQTKAWVVLSDRIKQFLIAQAVEKQNIFVCEHSDNSSIIKMIKHIGKASS